MGRPPLETRAVVEGERAPARTIGGSGTSANGMSSFAMALSRAESALSADWVQPERATVPTSAKSATFLLEIAVLLLMGRSQTCTEQAASAAAGSIARS